MSIIVAVFHIKGGFMEKCVSSIDNVCECLKIDKKEVPCDGKSETCKFRKTLHKRRSDTEKVYKRLRSLSYENQEYISRTYYGGECPWVRKETNNATN